MIRTWITAMWRRGCGGSAGRTRSRRASQPTGSTSRFSTGSSQSPRRPERGRQDPPMSRRDSVRTPAASAVEVVAQQLAGELARRGGPVRQRAARGLHELGTVDRAIYSAVAATPTPSLDEPLRRLSNAANHSGLWLAIAGGLGTAGG